MSVAGVETNESQDPEQSMEVTFDLGAPNIQFIYDEYNIYTWDPSESVTRGDALWQAPKFQNQSIEAMFV